MAFGMASTGNVNPEKEKPSIVNSAAMLSAKRRVGNRPTRVTATASQAMMNTNIRSIMLPTLPATGNLQTPYINKSSTNPRSR